MMELQNQIKEFILSEFGGELELESLDIDEDLIKRGVVDSMGVLQVINFIEQTYGLRIGDEEITVENFRSINAITNLIAQKGQVPV